jgi:hypothetical protein
VNARDDNPRWLAALCTAVPVAVGAALVLLFPPQPQPLPAIPARVAPPETARAPDPELDLLALYP